MKQTKIEMTAKKVGPTDVEQPRFCHVKVISFGFPEVRLFL